MRVSELIEELIALKKPDMRVILSKDAEGNEYVPAGGSDIRLYDDNNLIVYDPLDTAEENGFSEEEWETAQNDFEPVFVLWPGW